MTLHILRENAVRHVLQKVQRKQQSLLLLHQHQRQPLRPKQPQKQLACHYQRRQQLDQQRQVQPPLVLPQMSQPQPDMEVSNEFVK